MKFYIRRAVVGVLAVPVVAGSYIFGYLLLMLLGAEASISVEGAWNNGLLIGYTCAAMFTFSPQISKFLTRMIGA